MGKQILQSEKTNPQETLLMFNFWHATPAACFVFWEEFLFVANVAISFWEILETVAIILRKI